MYASLTPKHELELARRYLVDGDAAALEELTMGQLGGVRAMAKRYRSYGVDEADLVSEGMVGLLEAARRFDPERGLRFFTYARHWARARMLGFVLKQWSIVAGGTGAAQSKLFFQLRRSHAVLESKHGADHPLVLSLLAQEFAMSEGQAKAALHRLRSRDSSLDSPLQDGSNTTFLDLLPAADPGAEARVLSLEKRDEVRRAVARVWPTLSERKQAILSRRMMAGDDALSLAQLGREMGITRERVRQIEAEIKKALRIELTNPAASWGSEQSNCDFLNPEPSAGYYFCRTCEQWTPGAMNG
jgi:RNA polymerase sigma-32 factor